MSGGTPGSLPVVLHVHFGNRIEGLADALAEVLARPAGVDPLRPETVVVGHGGMGEWLKRALARRLGIAANLDLPFPASFIWSALRALDPDLPRVSPLDRGPLAWRLYRALAAGAGAGPAARYLADGDELAPFELARELASVFEQYQIYRPDWVRAWEAGQAAAPKGGEESAAWQAALWREAATGAVPNRAQLFADLVERADSLAGNPALPARVSVFGIPALPPAYFRMLQALARARDVHLFVPNPSREYWGDVARESRLARWRARESEQAAYREVGHPLLASLGEQNRDFVDLLVGEADAEFHDRFAPAAGGDLLARMQRGILDLEPPQRAQVRRGDGSLGVHVCHSRMREIEVLHDALLARFDADPDFGPEDVLVMAPEIADYASFVAAVFDGAPAERRIPWSIADRGASREHPIPEAFMDLLALADSRFAASAVLGLLELPAVARRFDLGADALARIVRWVEASGVRWGLDAGHRASFGLPAEPLFTWRFGLDRLLLGYALAPDDESLWQGIAPWTALEGQNARPLGALAALVAQFARWREDSITPRAPTAWAAFARELLSLFAPEDPDEFEALDAVRRAITAFEDEAALGGCVEEIPRAVAASAIAEKLAIPRRHQPFLAGRVTFCSLVPMRSIPAKLVWLLGMGENEFPRRGRAHGFDLIAAAPRKGDRARRTEDRGLFLDALCAARDAFHVSYVGRSERDDSPLPPSVVVAEFLDVATRMGADAGTIVTEYPLQPFSARYGRGKSRLASYASQWLGAGGTAPPARFAPASLAAETRDTLLISELVDGLTNPALRFLRRVGIATRDEPPYPQDDEPFELDGLGAWKLRDELLARGLAGGDFETAALYEEFAARALLLPGAAGHLAFARAAAEAAPVAAAVRDAIAGESAGAVDVALEIGGLRLEGRVGDVYARAGRVLARAGRLRAKDRLRLWIEHLALAAAGRETRSRLFAQDDKRGLQSVVLAAVADPAAELARLCELHARAGREPLPLLPELSYEFYSTERARDTDTALRKVVGMWNDEEHPRDEARMAEYRLVFCDGSDPFGDEFMALARELFGAIDAHAAGEKP